MSILSFDVEFTKQGNVFSDSEPEVLRLLNETAQLTDLFVISHGWNNNMAEATELYEQFFENLQKILEAGLVRGLEGRQLGALRVFWPSKRFADEELIPGGGAASATAATANDQALISLLDGLKRDPLRLGGSELDPVRSANLEKAKALVFQLEQSADARREFLFLLRSILDTSDAHPDDGSIEFFERDSEELFTNLSAPVNAPSGSSAGGATTIGTGGAASLGDDLIGGIKGAARRLANFATYYEMKQRAGLVGRTGLAQVLLRVRDRKPDLRLHLIGHSFGGRLVTAAANALPPGTSNVSLSLLQAAFSHNGLAQKFDRNGHDGAFRNILAERRVSGPIIITHTKNDKAVGIAYPLASRLARDNAAALGDENDPYGGMGRNGAQKTPEVDKSLATLEAIGFPYSFQTRKVYNLKADQFIHDHGDVTNPQAVYAVLHAMRSIGAVAIDQAQVGDHFANVTAPREIDDPKKREKWGLPPLNQPDQPGQYIIELNSKHQGGLSTADHDFIELCNKLIPEIMNSPSRPKPIAKSYYRCFFSDAQWRKLIQEDEQKPAKQRAIYRLWPDFPVTAHTDHSMATIKADAALRSFGASGAGIVWAVIDSGIQADHPHFGPSLEELEKNEALKNQHALYADEVRDLHRCFTNIHEEINGMPVDRGALDDPDQKPNCDSHDKDRNRDQLVAKHRDYALRDDFGHGTHVAGIIAGKAPPKKPDERSASIEVFERQYKVDADGNRISQSFEKREIDDEADPLRGVAPRCKLVSLRVLDQSGQARTSQVIQALEYIREHINDNPKLLRVHGVNLSVGYEFDAEMFACGQSPLCTQVDRLVQEGVVVVAAAGNTGYGTVAASVGTSKVGLSNTINDPGNADLAITVGATHRDMPHLYGVSYFSSKGPTGDGRIKPDLVAPGERITSCAAGAKLKEAIKANSNSTNCAYYVDDSGTSMAAPHVSGAIAAFLSIRREFIGKPLEVKRIFLDSATPLGRERYFEGHGLVDLIRAIQSV